MLAYSKATNDGYGELRIYPAATADAFCRHHRLRVGRCERPTGLEAEYHRYLEQHVSPATTLGQLLTEHKTTDDITLTVSIALQQGRGGAPGRTGAVVAIDPQTGASSPCTATRRSTRISLRSTIPRQSTRATTAR